MPAITITDNASGAETSPDVTIVLTGSTGSLGSYLLNSLTHQQHVRKIYCFNRAEDGGRSKQKTLCIDRGFDTSAWSREDGHDLSRVEFVHVDLSQPYFGLSRVKYAELLRETTHIIRELIPILVML